MPKVVFVSADGQKRWGIDAPSGESLLDVAHANDIDLEGACEGSMACSTCHVIVDAKDINRLPPPSEEEQDLLDLAYQVSPTSRLGCQIVLNDKLDGLTVRLPRRTNNLLLD